VRSARKGSSIVTATGFTSVMAAPSGAMKACLAKLVRTRDSKAGSGGVAGTLVYYPVFGSIHRRQEAAASSTPAARPWQLPTVEMALSLAVVACTVTSAPRGDESGAA
jgi:hypothetical protein